MRPTDLAKTNFQFAEISANDAVNNAVGDITARHGKYTDYELNMAKAIRSMCTALGQLSTGLRATYMLLEEVNGKLDRLGRVRPGPTP